MQKHLMNTKQIKKNISVKKDTRHRKTLGRVFVGMSGGVDSSVAAAFLQKAGYEVTGVFMKVWEPDFLPCTWREERLDAMRVAAHLGIPLLTWDFEREYKQGVADYMIREYRAGRTPNPDVMCNREVKFGAFFDRAMREGADFVATGHYARVQNKNNQYQMLAAVDSTKDQSYFLWTIGQHQLSRTLFPIGNYKKTHVRTLAKKFGLPTAEKKDSQGLCFVGKLDMKDFLAHFMEEKNGRVINERGETIGTHRGAYFYTLRERHGFTITQKGTKDAAYYVVAKDIVNNTITVAQGTDVRTTLGARTKIKIEEANFCLGVLPDITKKYHAQIRYHGESYPCKIHEVSRTNFTIHFDKPVIVDVGQSVVLYDGSLCLGGGIVA